MRGRQRPRYPTIVADPPWAYRSPGATKADARKHYATMRLEEICALPVSDLAEDDAHLWLWTTNAMMEEAHQVVRAWGFSPLTILTWCKGRVEGDDHRPQPGVGYYLRNNTEHVILAARGKPLVPANKPLSSWYVWPRRAHSQKPEAFYDLVEQVSPAPFLELFARRRRLGWDTWGLEAGVLETLEGNERGAKMTAKAKAGFDVDRSAKEVKGWLDTADGLGVQIEQYRKQREKLMLDAARITEQAVIQNGVPITKWATKIGRSRHTVREYIEAWQMHQSGGYTHHTFDELRRLAHEKREEREEVAAKAREEGVTVSTLQRRKHRVESPSIPTERLKPADHPLEKQGPKQAPEPNGEFRELTTEARVSAVIHRIEQAGGLLDEARTKAKLLPDDRLGELSHAVGLVRKVLDDLEALTASARPL